jgi:hypothetical protein
MHRITLTIENEVDKDECDNLAKCMIKTSDQENRVDRVSQCRVQGRLEVGRDVDTGELASNLGGHPSECML